MSAWLVSAALVAVLFAPAESQNPAAASAAIEQAVRDLGDARFSVRQAAARTLWQAGLAAEPLLQRAVQNGDRETRVRARRILDDFRYGILPGVPADTVAMIRQFRDGNAPLRLAAFQTLAQRGDFDTLQRLIGLESDAAVRRQLLVMLIQSPLAVEKLADLDQLEKLVAAVSADQDEAWRRKVLAQLLFSEKMIQRLADKRELDLLVKVIERETSAEVRREMLSILFKNAVVVAVLIDKDQLDLLLKLIEKEPEKRFRGPWIGQVLGNAEAIGRLAGDERLERVLRFAQEHMEAEQRASLLPQMFQNPSVVQVLLSRLGLDRLLALIRGESDLAVRGGLLAALVKSPSLRQQLGTAEQRRFAIELAAKETDPAAKDEYLKALLTGNASYFLMLDSENRQAVWALIKTETAAAEKPAANWRADALNQLLNYAMQDAWLRTPEEIGWLLRFLRDRTSGQQRGQILLRLVSDSHLRLALQKHAPLESLLALAKSVPASARGRLLAGVVLPADSPEAQVSAERAGQLVELAGQESEAAARGDYLQSVFAHSAAMKALLQGGFYEALWTFVTTEEDLLRQAVLRAEFVRTDAALVAFAEKQPLEALLTFAQETPRAEARREYLQRLLSNEPALVRLIDTGHYEALFGLADHAEDATARRELLGRLYTSPKVVQRLADQNQIADLLAFGETCAETGQLNDYLQRLFHNQQAASTLLEQGQLDALLTLANKVQEDHHRASLVAALLNAPDVVRQIADGEPWQKLSAWIETQPESARHQLYYALFGRPECVAIHVQRGRFDDLVALIRKEPRPERRGQFLAMLINQPAVIEHLTARKNIGLLLSMAEQENDEQVRRAFLMRLVSTPAAIAALAGDGKFDPLVKLARQSDDPYLLRQLVQRLVYDDTCRRALGEAKLGGDLADLLRAETDDNARQTTARQVVANSRLVQTLVDSGQADALFEIAKLDADEHLRRLSWQRILCSPSGLVPYRIRRGELDEAQRRLEQDLKDDLGRLHLAAFLLANGRLDARIDQVRARLQQTPDAADARLLTYLARANGDAATARQAAEMSQDPALLKAVLAEQGQWAEAARLQAAHPGPPPIATALRAPEQETHQRIEQLGLLAAYQRLAGDRAAWAQTAGEIQGLAAANPEDKTLQWFCVEALVLNDRVEDGLKVLAALDPLRAFRWYSQRYQYRQALELLGWRQGVPPDRAWLESLSRDETDAEKQALQRMDGAIQVARTLHLLGRRDEAGRILDLVEAYAQERPDRDNSLSARRECWERMCLALLAMGDQPRAWTIAARALPHPQSVPSLLYRLYPQRGSEAQGWWTFFRQRHRPEPPAETFRRVHRVMTPTPQEAAAEFQQLAAEAEQMAASFSDARRNLILVATGEAALRRKQLDVACRCLQPVADSNPAAASLLAETWWQGEQWPEAAAASESVWEQDHEQLAALYLSGEALERSGREDEGRRRKEQTLAMALDSRARMTLGTALSRHGLTEEAVQQFRLVLRTAPFESWEWQAAVHSLAERVQNDNPVQAAAWFEQSLLDDLRTSFYLVSDRDYLATPAKIHRLRAVAELDAGRWEAAERHVQQALTALPGETDVSEELVPRLEQAGRKEQADGLFQRVFGVYSEAVQAYPGCALLHNNLAWTAARCGRRLEEAQRHADRAIELAPDNASYLDTLAEVCFQRGDRQSALRHSRRALELRPDDETLQQQLKRFEQNPLPGSDPRRRP